MRMLGWMCWQKINQIENSRVIRGRWRPIKSRHVKWFWNYIVCQLPLDMSMMNKRILQDSISHHLVGKSFGGWCIKLNWLQYYSIILIIIFLLANFNYVSKRLLQVFPSTAGILLCEPNGPIPFPVHCCKWKDKSCGFHNNFSYFCLG